MAEKTAICYVTDRGFLTPSFTSAASIRRWVSAGRADILVLAIDCEREAREIAGRSGIEGLHVQPFHDDLASLLHQDMVQDNHVPLSAAGRLLMHRYVPVQYERVLYLDGDTYAVSDISPLLEAPFPDDGLLAAPCHFDFVRRRWGRRAQALRRYMDGLGMTSGQFYFNSGMLLARHATWRTLGEEAMAWLRTRADTCRYLDQSALNAVAGGRRRMVSLRWNFQTAFRHYPSKAMPDPALVHFTGPWKPWLGPAGPWADLYQEYMALFTRFTHPDLAYPKATEGDLARQDECEAAHTRKGKLLKNRLLQGRRVREMRRVTEPCVV